MNKLEKLIKIQTAIIDVEDDLVLYGADTYFEKEQYRDIRQKFAEIYKKIELFSQEFEFETKLGL